MPSHHVSASKARTKQLRGDAVTAAIHAIIQEGMSIRSAAKQYSISKSSLHRAYHKVLAQEEQRASSLTLVPSQPAYVSPSSGEYSEQDFLNPPFSYYLCCME